MKTLNEPVPVQPFLDWIDARVAEQEHDIDAHRSDRPLGPVEAVLTMIGWSGEAGARRLFRWRNELHPDLPGDKSGVGDDA